MNDSLDDLLDARLRDEAPYIDDAGFTARVLKELPRQARSLRTQRSFIILAAAILSVVVAYFASGEASFIQDSVTYAAKFSAIQIMLVALCCGLLTTVGGIWAAFSRTRDPIG